MISLLKSDIIQNSFIILLHFLNFMIGLAGLFIIFRRVSFVSPETQRAFFLQAIFYNTTLILSAATDFVEFFFWRVVSASPVTSGFLYFLNILALASYFLWAITYSQMTYIFLAQEIKLFESKRIKSLIYSVLAFLTLMLISRILRVMPYLYLASSMVIVLSILGIVFYHSLYLYRKGSSRSRAEERKALMIFGLMFMAFSIINIFVFLNFYPLHILPPLMTKFSYGIMDLIYNCLILFWATKYFDFLNAPEEPAIIKADSINENVEKYQISKRELEVIHLVCAGKSNQEIADTLFISLGTVKNHLYNVYSKIGIRNRTQLIRIFQ